MAFDWAPIISAGVSLAQGLLNDENKKDERADSRENLILNLQDNERDRAAALERQRIALEASKYASDTSLAAAKKRILGDVLLQQGKGQEALGIEAYRAAANKKERFNDAASVLAQVLSR